MTPEPNLAPPEYPLTIRCGCCHKQLTELFELSCSDFICRPCLAHMAADDHVTMDELSALLCVPVVCQD